MPSAYIFLGLFFILFCIFVVVSIAILFTRSCHHKATRKAYLTVVSTGVSIREAGSVDVVVWDPDKLIEYPANSWSPSFSEVDDTLVGWTVPRSGSYFIAYDMLVQYKTALIQSVAATIIVDGEAVGRSLATNFQDLASGPVGDTTSVSLEKSFMVNLSKGNVVSLILVIASGLAQIPDYSDLRFATTLTLDLRNPCNNTSVDNHSDFYTSTAFVGPLSITEMSNMDSNNVNGNNAFRAEDNLKGIDRFIENTQLGPSIENFRTCMKNASNCPEKRACAPLVLDALFQKKDKMQAKLQNVKNGIKNAAIIANANKTEENKENVRAPLSVFNV